MKERPILFNAGMVMAIIAGRKTQTRRVIKPQPDEDGLTRGMFNDTRFLDTSDREYKCPFGVAGDHLYVREAFGIDPHGKGVAYRATQEIDPDYPMKWKPSIHMPRSLSRINLLVNSVRVERLQDISDKTDTNDCLAEGMFHCGIRLPGDWLDRGFNSIEKCAFHDLWESIYGKKDGHSWGDNPWVWVAEFEAIN